MKMVMTPIAYGMPQGKIAAEYVVDTDGEYVGGYKAWQEDGREANDDIDDIRERVALNSTDLSTVRQIK